MRHTHGLSVMAAQAMPSFGNGARGKDSRSLLRPLAGLTGVRTVPTFIVPWPASPVTRDTDGLPGPRRRGRATVRTGRALLQVPAWPTSASH